MDFHDTEADDERHDHRSSSSSSTSSAAAFQLKAGVPAGRMMRRRRWWWPPSSRRAPRKAQLPAAACVAAVLLASAVVVVVLTAGGTTLNGGMLGSLFFGDAQGLEGMPPSNLTAADRLLDGLLTPEFRYRSCRSRYEFAAYHNKSPRKPSPYLVAKLRKHEALQRRCGPGTASYKKAFRRLESGEGVVADADDGSSNDGDCRYVVYISYRGLGNRMLAMASAFLYAVLTDRVLLVDGGGKKQDVAQLFCEPFPGATWLLPPRGGGWWWSKSPLRHLHDFGKESNESLGNLLRSGAVASNNVSWSAARTPPYVYLHLDGDYGYHDKLFFCGVHQRRLLRRVPWLLLRTDSYFVPGLFLTPPFRDELAAMFPDKDAVFHHLGRYLFHPTNEVWDAVTSYYQANLAGAASRRRVIGVQIRVYVEDQPPQSVLDQVLACVRAENLLPAAATTSANNTSVLVTSLSSWYGDRIRDEYGGRVAGGGVHQPSHEGQQRWGDAAHDMRALSDMYLLSTCDVLVTSGFSTFGYVAQGLAGRRPWVMPRSPSWAKDWREELDPHGPPCRRAVSVEPCFHSPSYYDCAAGKDVDLDKVAPYVRRCVDVRWGIKFVNESGSSDW